MNQYPQRPRPTQTRPSPARGPIRRKRRKKLRPAAIALMVVVLLLLSFILFGISYLIAKNAESARLAAEAQTEQQPADNSPTPSDTQNSEDVSDVGGADAPSDVVVTPDEPNEPEAEPDVTFAALTDIVTYVDSLGIDFSDRASFDMSAYFTSATLKPTADAGEAYQNETVYIGDSLVLHMGSRSNHPKSMVYGAASINPEDACVKKLTTLKNGTEASFAEAMAELQPKRIVITIGTNSMWMEPNLYVQFFSRFVDQLKAACPNTELILQSTPPLTAEYEEGKNYPTNEKINRFNMYLAGLATYHDIWYLNSAPELKNEGGTLKAEYDSDGFHISAAGYDVWTTYLRTHATTLQ